MLVKFKQLVIESSGWNREVISKEIFINPSSVISVADYEALSAALMSENMISEDESFSLVKINQGNSSSEVILFGSAHLIAEMISSSSGDQSTSKRLLND